MTKKTGPESPLRLEFGYDERSRRITKRVLTGSNYQTLIETRRFIWDGWLMAGEVIEKGSSTETKTYLWGWDVSGSEEGAGGVGGLIAVQNTSGVYFPIYDGNGNTRHLWGLTEGTVVDSADYGPFGELTQSPATEHSPFWFSSKYWDQESGFLYYGYRYYNPETGRWINRDPIEEDGGENLYHFTFSNPINWIDDTGLQTIAPAPIAPGPVPGIPGTMDGPPVAPNIPGVSPAAPGTIAGPGVAAGQTDAATRAGINALDRLIREGKICEYLRGSTSERIRNRKSRGGASVVRAQLPEVDRILQDAVNTSKGGCVFYRYDKDAAKTSFGAGTDVTTTGDLSWSRAISITYYSGINCLFVYKLTDKIGAVGAHPDGPTVMGLPQFQLRATISAPDVQFTKVLRKGDGD
jgi:RHS repeat-associated protein